MDMIEGLVLLGVSAFIGFIFGVMVGGALAYRIPRD